MMPVLSSDNFFEHMQYLLNRYLRPYKTILPGSNEPFPLRRIKESIRDGVLERSVHGAQHASRAAIWALMIHQFLSKIAPEYVNSCIQKISQFTSLTPEEILLHLLITVAGHDMGREGEGRDIWEAESATLMLSFLTKKLELKNEIAQLFSAAIQHKDDRESYFQCLLKLGIPQTDHADFDFIRLLLNLGDNLDLMRCVGTFKLEYIYNSFNTIDHQFSQDHKHSIDYLIQKVYQFIRNQKDMIFPCQVLHSLSNEILIPKEPACYSNERKTRIEQGTNVLATMLNEAVDALMIKAPFFGKTATGSYYLEDVKTVPFAHATNTSVFATMCSTNNWSLMNPLVLLRDAGVTSSTGELTKGGLSGQLTIIGDSAGVADISCAKLNAEGPYAFPELIRNYTRCNVANSKENAKQCLQTEWQRGPKCSFSNINLILIYLARLRQLGPLEGEIQQGMKRLETQLNATIQFYHLMILICTHIIPLASENLLNIDPKEVIETPQSLSYEMILQKIIEDGIDFQDILQSPTPAKLIAALKILNIDRYLLQPPPKPDRDISNVRTDLEYTVRSFQKNSDYDNIQTLLKFWRQGRLSSVFFKNLAEKFKILPVIFAERLTILTKMFSDPVPAFANLSSIDQELLNRPFPVIFIVTNDDKLRLYDLHNGEYRATEPLKLGTDIQSIVTDTRENAEKIRTFLREHQLSGITVILFNDPSLRKQLPRPQAIPNSVWTDRDYFDSNISEIATILCQRGMISEILENELLSFQSPKERCCYWLSIVFSDKDHRLSADFLIETAKIFDIPTKDILSLIATSGRMDCLEALINDDRNKDDITDAILDSSITRAVEKARQHGQDLLVPRLEALISAKSELSKQSIFRREAANGANSRSSSPSNDCRM